MPRDMFMSVLYASGASRDDVDTITEKLSEKDWVPYPKFLAMFEHAPSTIRPPTVITPHREPGEVIMAVNVVAYTT